MVRDAQTRLAQSNFAQNLGRDAKLSQLPIFFIAGEAGAAKTSTFVNSGVEPDLLAGQVYQDSAIISTRPVNIWLAQNSVFVESGGKLMGDPSRWAALIKKLHPKRRWWFIGGKPQAPRAVIVCVDSEAFLQPNAEEALTMTARGLHTRLGEISQLLGIRLPVYVLFTKLDRLAFFIDFVSNLSDEEATQVLGVTLPLRDDRSQGGVYAEEESRRLAAAFDELFHSLCDKRPPYLARENDANKLPAVYEFPREFRKLRNAAVRFLVDLGRPSQLAGESVFARILLLRSSSGRRERGRSGGQRSRRGCHATWSNWFVFRRSRGRSARRSDGFRSHAPRPAVAVSRSPVQRRVAAGSGRDGRQRTERSCRNDAQSACRMCCMSLHNVGDFF